MHKLSITRRRLLGGVAMMIGSSLGITRLATGADSTIALSASEVTAAGAQGDTVGLLSVNGDPWSFSLTDNAGGRFALDGNKLVVGATPLDHIAAPSPSVTVQATNGANVLNHTFTIRVRQPLLKDASSLTFASNRVSFPIASQIASSGDRSALGHSMHVAPEYGITGGMRLLFCNFYIEQSGGLLPEKTPGTSKTIDFVTVFVDGVARPVTFGGAESAVIADGGFVWSDVVMAGESALTMPARQVYYVRVAETTPTGQRRVFNAGQQLQIGRWANWSTSEGVEYSSSPQTGKKTSGTVGAYGGGTQSVTPHMIVANGWDGSAVYALFGDSIGASVGDFGSDIGNRGVLGHIGRALDDIGSGRRSYSNFCVPGTKPQDQSENAEGQMALRLAAIKALPNQPFTTIISRMGQNGIFAPHASSFPQFGSTQPENLQKAMSKWWAFLRNEFAADIFQLTVTPRAQNIAGSNAFWTDPTQQSETDPSVDRYPDGARARFNAWLLKERSVPAYVKVIDDRQAFFSPDVPFAWRKIDGEWTLATAATTSATTLTFDGSAPPPQGAAFVIGPGTENADVRTSYRVTGTGPWTVYVTGGGKANDAGTVIRASSTTDGLHPAHSLHLLGSEILIAHKIDGTLP